MTQNKKNFIWNTLGSGINSFNSLFLMIIVTRINGLKDAGIFSLCFATALMLYNIAIYSGRTYQVTETDENVTDTEYILHRYLSSIIMLFVAIIWGFIYSYNHFKLIILLLLCLFKITEALSDVFFGIMQKNERLDLVGKSLFIKGILNLLLFFITNYFSNNLILSCASLSITNIFMILIYDLKYVKKYKEKRVKKDLKIVLKIFSFGFYTFLYTLICNYLINVPRYTIDKLLDLEYQTIYGILVMPATIIMLFTMFIFQPVVTKLKFYYVENKKKEFTNLTIKIIMSSVIVGLITILFSYFFGIPILNFIYNVNLKEYLISFIIILFGAILYTISNILSNCLLIIRETKIQVLIYTVASIIASYISICLIKKYNLNGGAYTYFIMMGILFVMYLFAYIIKIQKWKIIDKKNIKSST